jgi:oxygen-dependent protoporphyrinogen oxidase
MTKKPFDYIVLGAGISGLSAAYYLQKSGASVLVIEKENSLGGVIQTKHIDGFDLELGPNTVQLKNEALEQLIQDLDLESDIEYPNENAKNRYILKAGKVVALPAKPQEILGKNSLLSLKDKVSFVRELFRKKHAPESDPSIDAFFRFRFGVFIADYFVNPFVAGIYSGDPKKLSLRSCFPQLWEYEQQYGSLIKALKKLKPSPKPIFKIKGGMQVLVNKLASELTCTLDAEITGISKEVQFYKVSYQKAGEEVEAIGKQIISTIPIPIFKGLYLEHFSGNVPTTKLNHAAVRVYHFSVDIPVKHWPHQGFGLLIPEKEKQLFLGCLFNSSIFPDPKNEDKSLLTVFVGGERQKGLLKQESQAFEKELIKNMKSVLAVSAEIMKLHRTDYPLGIPQYEVETYSQLLLELDLFEAKNQGFYFLGNFKNGVAVGDCVANAKSLTAKLCN